MVLCSYVPGLQSLVNAFSQCWDRLLLVFIPLFGLMYWFSTVGFLLFGKSCQDSAGNLDPLKCGGWDYFGTLGEAMWTLLQIATMDSWSSDIARTLYECVWGSCLCRIAANQRGASHAAWSCVAVGRSCTSCCSSCCSASSCCTSGRVRLVLVLALPHCCVCVCVRCATCSNIFTGISTHTALLCVAV